MLEYCSVVFDWIGRGLTQEIAQLRIQRQGQEPSALDWQGRYWLDFLNHMAQEGWELVTVAPIGGGDTIHGTAAYFKRSV